MGPRLCVNTCWHLSKALCTSAPQSPHVQNDWFEPAGPTSPPIFQKSGRNWDTRDVGGQGSLELGAP